MSELSLEAFHLKDNPFSGTPPVSKEDVVWAAREPLKHDMQELIVNSFISTPSRININWGEWGTGKTHSMKYFSREDVLDEISDNITDKKGLVLNIFLPKQNILESIYVLIINDLSMENFSEVIRSIAFEEDTLVSDDVKNRRIRNCGVSENSAKVFTGLISSDNDIIFSAKSYIYLDATRSDAKKIGVPRRITTKSEQTIFLSEIFRVFLSEKSPYSRILIWLDECESVLNMSGREVADFRSFLRSMIDLISNKLTIFLNASLKSDEYITFKELLGTAVLERVYKEKVFPYINEEETLEYIKQLVNNEEYRNPQIKEELLGLNLDYFPFNEDCIKGLFELLRNHLGRTPTPRNINDALSSAMEYTLRDNALTSSISSHETTITRDFIESNWDEIKLGINV